MNDKNIENPNEFITLDRPKQDNSVLERYQQMMNSINTNEKVLTECDIKYKQKTLKNNRRKEKERKKHNLRLRRRSK